MKKLIIKDGKPVVVKVEEKEQPEILEAIDVDSDEPVSINLGETPADIKVPLTSEESIMPRKSDLGKLITKDELLAMMYRLEPNDQKDMEAETFALTITPRIKKSVDPKAHHKWDMAIAHIRKLLDALVADKKLRKGQKRGTKAIRYVYNFTKTTKPIETGLPPT